MGNEEDRLHPPKGNAAQQQLVQIISAAVKQGLAPFDARLNAIEEEGERTVKVVDAMLGHLGLRAEQQGDEGESVRVPTHDTIWGCKKCGTRLGMYDPQQDVMRLRYKEMIVHIHNGIGGWIRVVCKSCAEFNVLEYATGVEEADDKLHSLQVAGDRLLLDEPLLLRLLEMARSADGKLVVRLVQAPTPNPQ